ncbi:HipA domain-containing protein [Oxalobacteraceae bacterium]|nr:HipA domain-containing protein [Oxalobacteraceae bacterium]
MKHVLHVYAADAAVGQLSFDAQNNTYEFTYATTWLSNTAAYYLAPAIPLGQPPHSPGSVQRFLENLLPEGRALDIAAGMNHLSKNNIFGLVRLLGKEPMGAFTYSAMDATVNDAAVLLAKETREPIRRAVTDEELSSRIRDRETVPFQVWDGKVRLSLAGYQDKLQVMVERDHISLVDGALSSTHLLKPDSRSANTPHLVANEHFCMSLADRLDRLLTLKLPAAPVELRRIPEPILLIDRFDRSVQWSPDDPTRAASVRRLHVIDACQALDFPSTFKYERNIGWGEEVKHIREGVSFARLFTLLDKMTTPAAARGYLVRWAVLQLLLGNSDAHGKNISFFVGPAGLTPAPMYDLVCVNVYGDRLESSMAMAYGDVFQIDEITPYALADFAHRTHTSARQLARAITTMANGVLQLAPELARTGPYIGEEVELVRKIAAFISAQAQGLLAMAAEIPKVDRKLFG